MISKLALLGGEPVITSPFSEFQTIGKEEIGAVTQVMESGTLSAYYGSWGKNFLGGPKVREFEQASQEFFNVNNIILF